MKKYLLTTSFIIAAYLFAVAAQSNVYLDLKPNEIVIGQYNDENFKRQKLKTFSKKEPDLENIKDLLLPKKGERLLFYFHSMLGGVHPYHRNSLKRLNKIENIDRIVSIVWHADKLKYVEAWELAIHQGYGMTKLMNVLLEDQHNEYHILCHSMGHRVFEGIASRWDWENIQIENIVLAASDLDVDVFEKSLIHVPQTTEKLTIYMNEHDRLLKTSAKKHGRERLGKHGHLYLEELLRIENLELINVSRAEPGRKIRFTNHIYFKNNPRVLADIGRVINGEEEERNAFFFIREKGYGELK